MVPTTSPSGLRWSRNGSAAAGQTVSPTSPTATDVNSVESCQKPSGRADLAREGLVDDLLLLDGVHLRRARRRCRHRATRNPFDARQPVGAHLRKREPECRPRALVRRLLLDPEVLLDVRIPVQGLAQPPPRQRRELLDTHDRDIVTLLLVLAGDQLVVNLAAGQQHALDLGPVAGALLVGGLLDHRLELAL